MLAAKALGVQAVFVRAATASVKVTVGITVDDIFPGIDIERIKRNLVDYAAGRWVGGSGQFETGGFRIGECIETGRLASPVNAVAGHRITTPVAVTDSSGGALPSETPLERRYTLAYADVSVTTA